MLRLLLLITLFSILPLQSYAQPDVIYPGNYVTEGGWGNLSIVKGKDNGVSFDIATVGANGHTCSLTGMIVKGQAVLESGEDGKPCIVKFQPKGDDVLVTDNDGACRYYCGARAGFTELYLKPRSGCEDDAIQGARKEFKLLYDKKKFALARGKLETVLKNCSYVIHRTEIAWIRNDLALTQYKLGDYAGCQSTLEPLKADAMLSNDALRNEYPPSDAETVIPIAEATRTNLALCTRRAKKP